MARIFVAYNRDETSEFADNLIAELTAMGHVIFTDPSRGVSRLISSDTQEKIRLSQIVLFLIGRGIRDDENLLQIYRYASQEKKAILPALIGASASPDGIQEANPIHVSDNDLVSVIMEVERLPVMRGGGMGIWLIVGIFLIFLIIGALSLVIWNSL